jgi:hypothetical protein
MKNMGVEEKLHTFLTLATDEGEQSASHSASFLGKVLLLPTGQETGWDQELVWMQLQREKFLSLQGIECLSLSL